MGKKLLLLNNVEVWVNDSHIDRLISLLIEMGKCCGESPLSLLPNLVTTYIMHLETLSQFYNDITLSLENNVILFESGMDYVVLLTEGENKNAFLEKIIVSGHKHKNPVIILIEGSFEYAGNYIKNDFKSYYLSRSQYEILVHKNYVSQFETYFKKFLDDVVLDYDNLLHLIMVVKNEGDSFGDILRVNLPYFDHYTIMDIGSTDDTIEIIRNTLKGKRGEIYEQECCVVKDARNRCIDLAGDRCKFLLFLNTNSIINENIRSLLE